LGICDPARVRPAPRRAFGGWEAANHPYNPLSMEAYAYNNDYEVEAGFAVGSPPDGPVDPQTFRRSREEVEELLREQDEMEGLLRVVCKDLFDPGPEPGVVQSVRVSGGLLPHPRVMPRREWRIALADGVY
jgi:hypothetical protein